MDSNYIITPSGMFISTNELYHHGVIGQKWGVRRYQNKDGSLTAAGKKRYDDQESWSSDAKTASTIKNKKVKEMSNAELKKLNERMRLEQEYSKLNPNAVKKGLLVVGGIAAGMGTVISLYNNSNQLINIGKKFVDMIPKK